MNIGLLSNFQQSLMEFCSFFYKSSVVGLEGFDMWLDRILVEWRLADVKLGFLQTFCRVQKVGEEALNERQRLDAERLSKTELVQPEGLTNTMARQSLHEVHKIFQGQLPIHIWPITFFNS